MEKAKIFYLAGHSISVTADSIITLAKQTLADKFNEKILMFNLAASYVSEKHIGRSCGRFNEDSSMKSFH